MNTMTDKLGNTYRPGDLVAVAMANAGSSNQANLSFVVVESIVHDHTAPHGVVVKGRPVAESYSSYCQMGRDSRLRTYIHCDNILALPGLSADRIRETSVPGADTIKQRLAAADQRLEDLETDYDQALTDRNNMDLISVVRSVVSDHPDTAVIRVIDFDDEMDQFGRYGMQLTTAVDADGNELEQFSMEAVNASRGDTTDWDWAMDDSGDIDASAVRARSESMGLPW